MSIVKYFKPKNILPSPEGPLSRDVPSSSMQAANNSEIAIVESEREPLNKREASTKSIPLKRKLTSVITTSAAIRHFKLKHPDLKWSIINDWKKAIALKTKKNYHTGQVEPITELECKSEVGQLC